MLTVQEAEKQLALAKERERSNSIQLIKERMTKVLSFDDAEDVITAGFDGKWIKVGADDARRLVKSIAGVNLIRGTKGQTYLESYQDRGLLVIAQHNSVIEPHPFYTLEELERQQRALEVRPTPQPALGVGI